MNAVDSIFASGRKPRTLVRGGFTPYPVKESPGLPDHCQACEGLIKPLPAQRAEELLATYRGWSLSDGKKILKEFKFKDFSEAKYFVDLVSLISEEQGHHPVITLVYNKVKITLTTHAAGGLTDNDFIMARTIDDVVFS
jgi:4a-hydroxytetrahydrobiopterin dehydratase